MRRVLYPSLLLFLGMGLLFVDFASKAYVNALLPFAVGSESLLFPQRAIFSNFLGGIDFSIVLAYNKGISWGLFPNLHEVILILRILVIFGILIAYLLKRKDSRWDLPFVLIVAGATGNVVDCLLYGYVIDFFRFDFWGHTFPIFNVADSLITLGVLTYILINFKEGRKKIEECSPPLP